jgi:hypothetical protein
MGGTVLMSSIVLSLPTSKAANGGRLQGLHLDRLRVPAIRRLLPAVTSPRSVQVRLKTIIILRVESLLQRDEQ